MTRTLIKEFSKWSPGNYEVEYDSYGQWDGGEKVERFVTKRAAYVFAEEQAREGRNARVYKLEED